MRLMLAEVRNVRQIPGERRRRWYRDSTRDLLVWIDDDGRPVGFQFCCEGSDGESAVTWLPERGLQYRRVDSGEGMPGRPKMAPILVPDGVPDTASLLAAFRAGAATLPPDIVSLVEMHLQKAALPPVP